MTSFISRLAAANLIDARTFTTEKGISFQAVIDGGQTVIDALAEMNVYVPQEVTRWSLRKQKDRQRSINDHLFPTKVAQGSQVRGCPICLQEDAFGSNAPPHAAMALRGDWSLPHVTLCHEHQHPLVPLWRESKPYIRFDSAAHLRELYPEIKSGRLDQNRRSASKFDVWFMQRLCGDETPFNWLDSHKLDVAANFCFMLGSVLLRHPRHETSSHEDWLIYQLGFEVASEGDDTILKALAEMQSLPTRPMDGPRTIFPVLYERLARQFIDRTDYDPFRDLLRNHMLKTWPFGIGDELMGKPILHRRIHSVRTAAQETGIDERRLRKILIGYDLVRSTEDGLSNAWEVFDAEVAKPTLSEITELIPANRFAALIGASRSQFDILIADAVFTPVLDGKETKSIWRPSDGRAFLDEMLLNSTPLGQMNGNWAHISKSAQQLKIRPGTIIEAIRTGKINLVGNYRNRKGYQSLYVNHHEVTAVLGNAPPPAQSIEVFSKSVGMNQPSKMRRLI